LQIPDSCGVCDWRLTLVAAGHILPRRMLLIGAAAVVAFVDVAVLPMDRERVERHQTVLVRDDRIVAIGPITTVAVPSNATVIDGRGRFLLPGLTDAHVHINTGMPWAPTRDNFGEAPLYLAHGVTTIFNLSGSPAQLEWRRRIGDGSLIGPTLYTSGPFINEPRFRTADDVRAEVARQAAAGYDIIKFHEFIDTTTGLSLDAYRALNEAARAAGIPLVGHAPKTLGLDTLLDNRQSLAHVGNLTNLYFMPIPAHLSIAAMTGLAIVVVLVTPFIRGPNRRLSAVAALATLAVVSLVGVTLPGGPLCDSTTTRLAATGATGTTIAIAVMLLSRRSPACVATGVAVALFAGFWVPVMWRSSDGGIARLATRLHDADISVQSTLIVYDAMRRNIRPRLLQDPVVQFLRPDTQQIWRSLVTAQQPGGGVIAFNRRVLLALHRAGVPIVAGTDAMGAELIAPGSSLHRELGLLTESGLTNYEAIRAATVAPAVFLRKDREFGTVAIGRRADLLLVESNPLERLPTLKEPLGVMVRGRWLTREQLQELVAPLSNAN
jgi:Amidohydrolase family